MVYTPTNSAVSLGDIPIKAQSWLKERQPKSHHHFCLADFFAFHNDKGTISDWNDARNILVTEDFIIGLIQGLEEEIGTASPVIMYNIGKEWGNRDAKFFKSWFEKEYAYEKGINQYHLLYVLEAWWWPFISQGWGNWDVDLSDQKNGFIFVNIFDSAVARTLGDVGKPVCHIYAGLMAGFFSTLTQNDLNCIEVHCYAMGETYCKFLVGKQDRIDAATFWQNEGATARDIEKRLQNGEFLK
jgi:hypothetical protein